MSGQPMAVIQDAAGFDTDRGRLCWDLVGARGFEPPTSCSQSRRAARLRYAPISKKRDKFLPLEIKKIKLNLMGILPGMAIFLTPS